MRSKLDIEGREYSRGPDGCGKSIIDRSSYGKEQVYGYR